MSRPHRVVLVGTYKAGQLSQWRGWYNYPISEADKISEADAAAITELWLFNGTKAQKTYRAEFVGVKTRAELVSEYGYPAKGKAHGERYLLFKTQLMYTHEGGNPLDCERVIVRTKDFSRSPKVRKQLKVYLESSERSDPILANMLPRIVTRLKPEQLRVCEAAVQMDFLDAFRTCSGNVILSVPDGEPQKFTLATVFSGIGAIEQALLRKHIDHEIVFACDNGDQTPFQCRAVEWHECVSEFRRLNEFIDTMCPVTESQRNAAEIVRTQRDTIKSLLDGAPATSKRPERELKDRVHMLHEAVGFYKFRVTWEAESDWTTRKHLVDMLYRPLLKRNNVRKSYFANHYHAT